MALTLNQARAARGRACLETHPDGVDVPTDTVADILHAVFGTFGDPAQLDAVEAFLHKGLTTWTGDSADGLGDDR